MSTRYKDVDLMIFDRWDEVKALREAFDELVDRIENVVESTLQKVSRTLEERGFVAGYDLQWPSIYFSKPSWHNRKREDGVRLEIIDFLPVDCGKKIDDHPSLWCMTNEFEKLRMKETPEQFGRTLRSLLPTDLAAKWNHEQVDIAEWPLGRNRSDVSEPDRVRMAEDPEILQKFLLECADELTELVPAIDQALQQMTKR